MLVDFCLAYCLNNMNVCTNVHTSYKEVFHYYLRNVAHRHSNKILSLILCEIYKSIYCMTVSLFLAYYHYYLFVIEVHKNIIIITFL